MKKYNVPVFCPYRKKLLGRFHSALSVLGRSGRVRPLRHGSYPFYNSRLVEGLAVESDCL